MKYRIWDKQKKKWASVAAILLIPGEGGNGYYRENNEALFRYTFYEITLMKDKDGRSLTEGDVVSVEDQSGETNTFVIRKGICKRVMDTGSSVDINGFYFQLFAPGTPFHRKPYFQINDNFKGGHDSKLTTIIGHIEELPGYQQ